MSIIITMWFIYALLGAVGKSYSGFFRKKIAKTVSGSMYIWAGYTIVLVALTPYILTKLADLKNIIVTFPIVILSSAITYMIATQLSLEALKREDLSYVAPLNAFVPVFTLGIAMLFLGEKPPDLGLLGVLIVFAGAYIISIKPGKIRWYDPLVRLFTSTGAQFSLGVALFYAINTILLKVLTNGGFSPLVVFYVTTLAGWLLMINVPILKRKELRLIKSSDKLAVFAGGFSSFVGGLFHILAVASTYTSYAASVRRLDSIFSVLLGWRYLKEKDIKYKLAGSLVMVIGSIVMITS